eukprot:CAMPEP_0170057082 /NCGR_PEP_ID=MMETSP0019_2-20121128/228_1 /TAXON_ID=98059 /ORGANISM="Dinobryon sp., Strain UTEXLB2267" /LENGTH=153 /DNA_ID=CAMNT_0010261713 /DNA_START=422 /DNA_END=883 /DNA_ORIENTATION=-
MKYQLPLDLPPGCQFWDMLLDGIVSVFCLPCSLAQMARHVFQYEHMDTSLGLFVGDPSSLPPLRDPPRDQESGNASSDTVFERPVRADTAGLIWTVNAPHPDVRDNRGAAHRQEELRERQEQIIIQSHRRNINQSSAPIHPDDVIYNQDGSLA